MTALKKIANPVAEVITLAEAKAHLREASSDFDAIIQGLIPVVRDEAEQRTGRSIGETTWLLTMDAFPEDDAAIPLPKPPALSLVSVAYTDSNGDSQTLSDTKYYLDNADDLSAWLLPVDSWPATKYAGANSVRVTYKAGYTADTLKPGTLQWMKMRLATWYEHVSTHGEGIPTSPSSFVDRLLDSATVDGGVG